MAAVMREVYVDRSAFRRLDDSLHGAENALIEWGRFRARDRAPNELPAQSALSPHMKREWLEDARADPPHEPEWMPRMVALYARQTPVVQQFMRLRWQHGYTTEQSRMRLSMSVRKANDLVRDIRKSVRDHVLLAM